MIEILRTSSFWRDIASIIDHFADKRLEEVAFRFLTADDAFLALESAEEFDSRRGSLFSYLIAKIQGLIANVNGWQGKRLLT